MILVRLVGVLHCYIVAKDIRGSKPAVWFSRWYSIVGLFFIVPPLAGLVVRTVLWEPFFIPYTSILELPTTCKMQRPS